MITLELEKEDAEELVKALFDYKQVLLRRAAKAFRDKQFYQVIGIQSFIKKRINKIHLMIMDKLNKNE